jgi:phosphohistidine phosphatase
MKELIFVRHAKSDWGSEMLKDIDRHLSERGYSDAYFMSDWYKKNKTAPDILVSSTAVRALSTALIFSRALDIPISVLKLEPRVYEASSARILQVVQHFDKNHERVMIFGHNPGFTNVCNELSPEFFFENVPTCGMVSFRSEISEWREFGVKNARINYFQFPKDFRNKP